LRRLRSRKEPIMSFLCRAFVMLAISGFAIVGNAALIITYNPARTSSDGQVQIFTGGAAVLIGGPPSNIVPSPKFSLVTPFTSSLQSSFDWGNESMGETNVNNGNVVSEADAFAAIGGNGTNLFHVRVFTDASLTANQPTLPSGYGGGAGATVNIQLYSLISGLVPGQRYTLQTHYDADYIAPPGKSGDDFAQTDSIVQAFVGDNSHLTASPDLFLNSHVGLDTNEVESGSLDPVVNFVATAASMDLWVQVNQYAQVSANGPSNLDDEVGAGFANDIYFSVSAVPEPASLCSFCIGTTILLACQNRRRRLQVT
jgi:hypothetical protein